MKSSQSIVSSAGGREFVCSPAAVVAIIVREDERILMLLNPLADAWEVVNGALDAGETILEGLMREVGEEAGDEVKVRPLGLAHAYSFAYDPTLPYCLSFAWVLAYEGGEVIPGDDMAGSEVRWLSVDELESKEFKILVPRDYPWLFKRAVELYRLWKDQPSVALQAELDVVNARPKPGKK